ncbi:MAG: BON domain-containing protein, partial [Chromatiaceae bacterium]
MFKLRNLLKVAALATLAIALQGCAAKDRRTLGSQIDDNSIVIKAGNAIEANKTLEEKANINVYSYNGVILLTGQAPNQAMV